MNNAKRLFRNTENKMLGGVATGFADYFDIDVTWVRVLFVLAVFFPAPFPMVLVYLTLWVVMPARKHSEAALTIDSNPVS